MLLFCSRKRRVYDWSNKLCEIINNNERILETFRINVPALVAGIFLWTANIT